MPIFIAACICVIITLYLIVSNAFILHNEYKGSSYTPYSKVKGIER